MTSSASSARRASIRRRPSTTTWCWPTSASTSSACPGPTDAFLTASPLPPREGEGEGTMKLPARVTICEVGTRDGFQIEPDFIPTDLKVEVVNRLAATGMPRIEVTSFVHPRVVPQLKDAEEVMARISRRLGPTYAALVPNA